MHLYQVTTVFERLYEHEGGSIQWYVGRRDKPIIPYWTVIKDYLADGSFKVQEDAVDELFREDEASDLERYITEAYKTAATTITEVELPITKEMQSLRSRPYFRGEGLIVLLEHLPLPKANPDLKPPAIPIAGYYNFKRGR